MQRVTFSIDSLRIHFCASTYRSSARLQRFFLKRIFPPKHNNSRNSRRFFGATLKAYPILFLDTHCLPAILLLFHPSCSFFRVPFVLVTHCQKHARNEISITFFIPSRTYIHFNFISSLWFFPFFLFILFYIYLFSFDSWNRHRSRRCLMLTLHVIFGRDNKRRQNLLQYLLSISDSKSVLILFQIHCGIY